MSKRNKEILNQFAIGLCWLFSIVACFTIVIGLCWICGQIFYSGAK